MPSLVSIIADRDMESKGNAVQIGNSSRCCKFHLPLTGDKQEKAIFATDH